VKIPDIATPVSTTHNDTTLRQTLRQPVDTWLAPCCGANEKFTALRLLIADAEDAMSLVRLLGFTTLACGCVVGRYREVATSREVAYVEEKGKTCGSHYHRRNHTVVGQMGRERPVERFGEAGG
jgi:hypothetical protein